MLQKEKLLDFWVKKVKKRREIKNLIVENENLKAPKSEKWAQNLLESIQNSKKAPLNKVIFALGIPHVGKESAKCLVNHFGSLENILSAGQQDLEKIDGFGSVMAQSVFNYFEMPQTKQLLKNLENLGVEMKPLEQRKIDGKFFDKTFVLTGTLQNHTREQAKEIIENFGGKVTSSVSKKTSYLLAGQNPGSKLKNAQKLGVKVISEQEFDEL
jgi:DNA ligase (NAD+)